MVDIFTNYFDLSDRGVRRFLPNITSETDMQVERFLECFDEALAVEGLFMTRPDPADPLSGKIEPDFTVSLSNLYQACAEASDSEAMQEIGKFVTLIKQSTSDNPIPDRWEDVRPHLLPIVRNRASIHLSCLASAVNGGEDSYNVFPHRDVGQDHIALVAVDSEAAIMMPGREHLERWGKTFEEAFEEAMANLARQAAAPYEDLGNGFYACWNGGHYESSRLLLPSFWDGLPDLAGDPVVLCPSKDAILISGSENPEGLADMACQAADVIQRCSPLSGLAMIRRNGAWQRFPESADANCDELRSLGRQWLALQYDEQNGLLEEMLEQQSKDIFVATFGIVPQLPGIVGEQSFSTWTEDVHTWLPEAEYVFFVRSRDDVSLAPWDAVRSVMGSRMNPIHHHPPRYEVQGFPTAEDFAAMGAQPLVKKEKKKGMRALLPW